MSPPRDYYEILGITPQASPDEIRRAYRALAREYHPDVNDAPDAVDRFREVSEAYAVLSDEGKRSQYDRLGHAGIHGAFGEGGFSQTDVSSIFEQVFGANPFQTQPEMPVRPRKGRSITHTITVTFITACLGGTERIRLEGSGVASHTIELTIPPGIRHGAKLRAKGKGDTSTSGGAPGDLIVTVGIGAHPFFRRDGLDILADLPVNIAEAALGTHVTMPLLRGSAEIVVPPGSSSGLKLRIPGRGITIGDDQSGDFLAVIQVIAPPVDVTEDQRQHLEQLRKTLPDVRNTAPWLQQEGSGIS